MSAKQEAKTGFLYDDIYLRHLTGAGHPERPERLTAIVNRLKDKGIYPQLRSLSPVRARKEWLTTVHTSEYVARVKNSWQNGIRYLDTPDVPISQDSCEAALMAAGGVLKTVDTVIAGTIKNAFCAVRPPGHHALADAAMGFCIFNNIAIAAKYIQKKHKLPKVLIVDWDVHHGNGTQAAFYDDPTVLYFSVHQHPFYPGMGAASEKGTGKGSGFTINVPLAQGSGDRDYIRIFKETLQPAAVDFDPDFVLVSAGFDAHQDDLLGGMKVTTRGFATLTRIVKDVAEQCCGGRLVSLLEGGYHLEGLAASVEAHIKVLI
ncbi:MAG: histone deacetylase [Planctomycetota bacterium]|nr:MAG: histone deacetylase [Planctomycetota bacterium]